MVNYKVTNYTAKLVAPAIQKADVVEVPTGLTTRFRLTKLESSAVI